MLLAVVLSFAAVTLWTMLFSAPRKATPPKPNGGEESAAAAPEDAPAGAPPPVAPNGEPAAPAGDDAAPDAEEPQASAAAATIRRETPEMVVTFTTLGGAVESISLKSAIEPGAGKPIDLIVPADPTMLYGQSDPTVTAPRDRPYTPDRRNEPAGPQRTLHWTRDEAAERATPEDDVVFTFEGADGVLWRKRWILPAEAGRYDLGLNLSAKRLRGSGPDKVEVGVLVASGLLRETFEGAFGTPGTFVVMRQAASDAASGDELVWAVNPIDTGLGGLPDHVRLFGVRSNYFLAACYADSAAGRTSPIARIWGTGEEAARRPAMEANLLAWFRSERGRDAATDELLKRRIRDGAAQMHHAWAVIQVPVAAATDSSVTAATLTLYTGPLDRATLAHDAYAALRPALTYPGAPDLITRFLLWIYDQWRKLLGSAGLAVIFMTLTVRGGLMPISIRNQLSMRRYGRKVQKVKPKLLQLQQKFANNPRKLREEQMKLYRENGIGFPGGCLMMLIQIPIFFALFSGLRTEYTLWGEPFLWIKDLAGPDRLIPFGTTLFDLGLFRLDALNILPILMVVVSILHYRSMPKPADEQQAQQMRMMKWLPIFFAFLLYNYTAALALYMVFSAVIGLVEAKIVRVRDEADLAATAAAATA